MDDRNGHGGNLESDQFGSLLEHEYDGIREYDNPTPGWWHLMFIGSIVFGVLYAGVFHLSNESKWFPADHLAKAKLEYNRRLFGDLPEKMEPSEANLLWFMSSDNFMTVGAGVFATNCVQCHGGDGGGINGPNLTDDSYINVKQLADFYDVVSSGVVVKGMPAWDKRLSHNEMMVVAAYAASLRGTSPAEGKAPEGVVLDAFPAVPAPSDLPPRASDTPPAASDAAAAEG
jgi:cytochrome c oxidase cbb3-type subunit 3